MDTNPMKPITRKNIGKNWEKGSKDKYEPHIGKKQKRKAHLVRERAERESGEKRNANKDITPRSGQER
jgi:hypothetical protein